MSYTIPISLQVNGRTVEAAVSPRLSLADWLRNELNLTGTHVGCEHGVCGACTVLMDERSVRSCLLLAAQANGREIQTVEGLSPASGLSPLQECFRKHHALQCGFCTAGILTTAHALLRENPHPTRHEIQEAISGNLCRCTGYVPIVDAIEEACAMHADGAVTSKVCASAEGKAVGQAVERAEDERLLRGEGCYVDDFKLPGLTHAVVVRSQVAHGRILSIDTEAARSMDGVIAVLVYADIEPCAHPIPVRVGALEGLAAFQQRPLAKDFVRYVGEPIAVVIAEDRHVAEDAADLVFADIESIDAVVTMADATSDSIAVHESVGTNIASQYVVQRGDADAAFASACYTRAERFRVHRHSSVPLETRGLVAEFDETRGHLRVWGAAKVPFYNRKLLASMLSMPENRVDLIELDVGGSFGARGEFYPEDLLIPLAAKLTRRPVKWIEDRRENLLSMNHSRDIECELEIAADSDGTIRGLRASLRADMGAYSRTTGGIVPAKAASFLPGPYDIANYRCAVQALITNKTPAGTFRGPGRFEANFFRERMIDIMASDLRLDPMHVRMKNLIQPGRLPYSMGPLVPYESTLSEYDSGDYPAAFAHALEKIDYESLREAQGQLIDGKLHGIGAACFVDSSGSGPAEFARLSIESPAKICLFTGASSSGQGHETTFAQILADEIGMPVPSIRIFHGSTTGLAQGVGTFHGRGLVMGGSAVKNVGARWVEQLLGEASRRSARPVEHLVYREGSVHARDGGAPIVSIAQLCDEAAAGSKEAHRLLQAEGEFTQNKLTFEYGSQIAHVAIDVETCAVEVVRMITVEDCGNVINPLIVHGQVIGACVQGLGGTFLEEFLYDESGQMLSATFADYLLPTSTDFPNVEAYSVNFGPSKLNPLGAKGVGEGAIEGVGGAIANAVSNALRSRGVEIRSLPLSPNNLSRWLREAGVPN